ncbi:MAG: hypothetical protein MI922_29090 [Bacteroidales bacterium]|nr:hypothetical protein [Bacteroidales bacterium]
MKKLKVMLVVIAVFAAFSGIAQEVKTPVIVYLKSGESIDCIHFGQLKCGTNIYQENYIILKGKFMGSVTEIKDYNTIEKIILEGYKKAPIASVGNEKAVIRIFKKNGVSVSLEEAEIALSCYGPGDLYNQIVVQIYNPLTEKSIEKAIDTRSIQSIIFK